MLQLWVAGVSRFAWVSRLVLEVEVEDGGKGADGEEDEQVAPEELAEVVGGAATGWGKAGGLLRGSSGEQSFEGDVLFLQGRSGFVPGAKDSAEQEVAGDGPEVLAFGLFGGVGESAFAGVRKGQIAGSGAFRQGGVDAEQLAELGGAGVEGRDGGVVVGGFADDAEKERSPVEISVAPRCMDSSRAKKMARREASV